MPRKRHSMLLSTAFVTAIVGLTTNLAYGSVIVESSAGFNNPGNGTLANVNFGTGDDRLLIVLAQSRQAQQLDLTYDGNAMSTLFVSDENSGAEITAYYVLNPVNNGALAMTSDNRKMIAYYALSNAAQVAPSYVQSVDNANYNSDASGDPSVTDPAIAADSLFISSLSARFRSFNFTSASSTNGTFNEVFAESNTPNLLTGYSLPTAAGSVTHTYDIDTDAGSPTVGTNMYGITVNAIPEPASLALMGLGGLLMLGRSRR